VGIEKQRALQPVINLHFLKVKMRRVGIYKVVRVRVKSEVHYGVAVACEALWKDSISDSSSKVI